jgi:hypothetical protein
MPTTVDCPACDCKLRVPDRLRGKQVKCPECGDTFPTLPLPETPPSSPQAETLVYTPNANAQGGANTEDLAKLQTLVEQTAPARSRPSKAPPKANIDEQAPCPNCSALNPPDARACHQCGAEFEVADEEWEGRGTRRDSEPHRGPTVFTLGVISVVWGGIMLFACPLVSAFGLCVGIPAWIMGHRDLKKMRQNVMDPRGERQTRSGWICAIVGTVLSGLGAIVGAFAMTLYVIMIVGIVSAKPPPPGTAPRAAPGPIAPAPGQPRK